MITQLTILAITGLVLFGITNAHATETEYIDLTVDGVSAFIFGDGDVNLFVITTNITNNSDELITTGIIEGWGEFYTTLWSAHDMNDLVNGQINIPNRAELIRGDNGTFRINYDPLLITDELDGLCEVPYTIITTNTTWTSCHILPAGVIPDFIQFGISSGPDQPRRAITLPLDFGNGTESCIWWWTNKQLCSPSSVSFDSEPEYVPIYRDFTPLDVTITSNVVEVFDYVGGQGDIVALTVNITNHGNVELDRYDSANTRLLLGSEYNLTQYEPWNADHGTIMYDICPFWGDNPNIPPNISELWAFCFRIPDGEVPTMFMLGDSSDYTSNRNFIDVSIPYQEGSRTISPFYATDDCTDIFPNNVCLSNPLIDTPPPSNNTSLVFVPDSGNITIHYLDGEYYNNTMVWLQYHEDVIINSNFILNNVVLPYDLNVYFQECGTVNAYYHPATDSITMCYELVHKYFDTFGFEGDGPTYVTNTLHWVFMHELGHA